MQEAIIYAAFLLMGLALGAAAVHLAAKARMAAVEQKNFSLESSANEANSLRDERQSLLVRIAGLETTLEKEREAVKAKEESLKQMEAKFSDTFKSLSADALKSSGESFLELAKASFEKLREGAKGDLELRKQAIEGMVKPLKDTLQKFDEQVKNVEKERVGSYESLRQQLKGLSEAQDMLKRETGNLVRALASPRVRGRWGEIQLRRVVELAGMLGHCDFHEQQTASNGDAIIRPDMIVRLPGGKNIVVDSKAPLGAYMEALEAKEDKERAFKLSEHARQIRDHIRKLAQKSYWAQFEPTPEFVVMFLPGEMMFGAALEQNPELVEQGVSEKVILATPTTLIALLKAVAYGWRQENVAENARQISELGRELYDRVATMASHFSTVGKSLEKSVESYNKAAASLESRVLVSTRKFKDLKSVQGDKDIPPPNQIESHPRQLQTPSTAEPD